MSTTSLAVNQPSVNTKSIEVAGRQYTVTRLTERCWLLTDDVTLVTLQFPTPKALWAHVDRMRTPAFRVLDLPQLPARAQSLQQREDRTIRRNRVEFFSKHPKRYPTRGVIALPTPEKPKPNKEERGIEHTRNEFLKAVEAYFGNWAAINSEKLAPRDARNRKWDMDCALMTISGKAMTYYQLVSQAA